MTFIWYLVVVEPTEIVVLLDTVDDEVSAVSVDEIVVVIVDVVLVVVVVVDVVSVVRTKS